MAFLEKLKDKLGNVKDSLLNYDLERIKSVSKLKAEEAAERTRGRRKKEAELEAVRRHAAGSWGSGVRQWRASALH